ncbi:hypothetical protein D3C87_1477550 [compost metagenome]
MGRVLVQEPGHVRRSFPYQQRRVADAEVVTVEHPQRNRYRAVSQVVQGGQQALGQPGHGGVGTFQVLAVQQA